MAQKCNKNCIVSSLVRSIEIFEKCDFSKSPESTFCTYFHSWGVKSTKPIQFLSLLEAFTYVIGVDVH